jgi:hypothetical protein
VGDLSVLKGSYFAELSKRVRADYTSVAFNTGELIGKRTGLYGWPSGTSIDSEDTMKFSARSDRSVIPACSV